MTLSVRVYAQASEATVVHLRTKGGRHEVDLIEVKLGATPHTAETKHLTWLPEELGEDLLDAVVITTGPDAYRGDDAIAIVPAALLGP